MITIIGAGMGGLTLANLLHKNGVPVTVYDADASPHARPQGGMLNINADNGQLALAEMGLLDAFHAASLTGGEALRVLDKTATVRLDHPDDGKNGRPEIDRGSLRDLLLSGLPDGIVHWGHKLTAVTPTTTGHTLRFADDTERHATTLIGADGTWSKVRPLLTQAIPAYTGISFVELTYTRHSPNQPIAARLMGQGLAFALSDGKAFIGHREPDDCYCIYASLPLDAKGTSITRDALHLAFADWHPDFHALIASSDGDLIVRPLFALPTGTNWPRLPGVTLLGDAAHVTSPFAGEGVNLAMQDAADLARAILTHPNDLNAAFTAYESTMFPRAEQVAHEAAYGLDMAFEPAAPAKMLAFFAQMQPGGPN